MATFFEYPSQRATHDEPVMPAWALGLILAGIAGIAVFTATPSPPRQYQLLRAEQLRGEQHVEP